MLIEKSDQLRISVFLQKFEWGDDKLADLDLKNNFEK